MIFVRMKRNTNTLCCREQFLTVTRVVTSRFAIAEAPRSVCHKTGYSGQQMEVVKIHKIDRC